MNRVHGARLSEHGHANALDISGFVLADGRVIAVKSGWSGTLAEGAFLRAVHGGACHIVTTVLGPGFDANHRDHFHLDLAAKAVAAKAASAIVVRRARQLPRHRVATWPSAPADAIPRLAR